MSKDKIVEAFRAACRNAETKRGEVCLHASDWMALSDTIAALASQPRDDVREASTYERLGQMLRRENLKPTARFLDAAYLGYNLCRMERDGRIDTTRSDTPSGEGESSIRHEGSGTGSAI